MNKLIGLAFSLIMLGSQSSADVLIYNIDAPNSELSAAGYSGPFGTVTVTLTSPTQAMVTFSANTGYLFGAQGIVDLNVNATNWSATPSGTQIAGFTPGSITNGGSGNISAFGVFSQTFDNSGGYSRAYQTVSIGLSNISSTWASESSVLATNSSGFPFASHIFVCTGGTCTPANKGGSASVTGYASGSIAVPEPSTYLLLGSCLAVGCYLKKRYSTKNKTVG